MSSTVPQYIWGDLWHSALVAARVRNSESGWLAEGKIAGSGNRSMPTENKWDEGVGLYQHGGMEYESRRQDRYGSRGKAEGFGNTF
jgi:hypothetical protein